MFTFKKIAFATAVAGATFATAQSLSSQCQSTLASLAVSSEASCLNPTGLISFVTLGSNSSVIAPINTWLTGLCSKPACTNSTLASVVTNVTSGCSSDLSSLNLSTSDVNELISVVQEAYPTARQVVCLDDTSDSNTLCVTETLYDIQNQTGTLTTANIESLALQIVGGALPSFLTSNVTCTNCTQAALNIIGQNFPSVLTSSVNSTISGQCGASFLTAPAPATISQSADSSAQAGSTSGAAAFALPFGAVALSALLGVSSVFAVFA